MYIIGISLYRIRFAYIFGLIIISLLGTSSLYANNRALDSAMNKSPLVGLSGWMGQILQPAKSNYTLKDIVIPGSHDAGMSILSATGGSQKATINECNTLTQSLSIEKQMKAGIRMFDLRPGVLKDVLYLKHSSSDCMEDAVGGGYGEKLEPVLLAAQHFLKENPTEFLILGFSHFCPKEITTTNLATKITKVLGAEHVFLKGDKKLGEITINELAGKVLLIFETENISNPGIALNTMTNQTSTGFMNFRRAYAATNNMKKLLNVQIDFFNTLSNQVNDNDLIRLDWQLTQSPQEAAMVCNAFESDETNPLFDGALLLTNLLGSHKSILTHARKANKALPSKMNDWIKNKTINNKNKPNIIYVDDAGEWVTQYCIALNQLPLYQK